MTPDKSFVCDQDPMSTYERNEALSQGFRACVGHLTLHELRPSTGEAIAFVTLSRGSSESTRRKSGSIAAAFQVLRGLRGVALGSPYPALPPPSSPARRY